MTRPLSTRTAWVIFVALVVLLIVGTTIPNDLKSDIEGRMWDVLPWSALAHFTLFTLIGLCPVYGSGWRAVIRAVVVAATLACLTEALQTFVPGRHPMLRDVGIDLGGTGLALLLGWLRRKRTDCT